MLVNDIVLSRARHMMLKDLRISQLAAQNVGATTPLGAEATALYTLFNNLGNGMLDFSSIIKLMEGDIDLRKS
jgi:3-hydroxyisobutyrate dehydrogenase